MPMLHDGDSTFETLLLGPSAAQRAVVFAAGRGGDPRRHRPLLEAIAARGCRVLAPCFGLLPSPAPNAAQLRARGRRLKLSLDAFLGPEVALIGVGHSIGASLLLGLAGAVLWTMAGEEVQIGRSAALRELVLLAPALDFVQAPHALDEVELPILAWAGSEDRLVPPLRMELLRTAVGARAPVDVRVAQGADHFSFMDELPPQVSDSHPDRAAWLRQLHADIAQRVAGPSAL